MGDVEDAGGIPPSDSFWEVDCFKRTVRRTDDGMTMCHELVKLMQERAELEKDYAKHLKEWAKKWSSVFEKGPEYGTNRDMLIGVLSEAENMADVHTTIKDQLVNVVAAHVKDWKSEHYKKNLVGSCKVTKGFEDEFKKAQKPWAKQLSKVNKSKKDFHNACKQEKLATSQENIAKGDPGVSPDQLAKLRDKAEKSRKEVEQTQDKYEQNLKDLNSLTPRYMEDMNVVFTSTQEFEEKRLNFFKKTLYEMQILLDVSQNSNVANIYQQMRRTVDQSNSEKDLKWWAEKHGVGMTMAWPIFEEYTPEIHTIGRKSKGASAFVPSNNGIELSGSSYRLSTAYPAQGDECVSFSEMTRTTVDPSLSRVTVERAQPNMAVITRQTGYYNPFGGSSVDENQGVEQDYANSASQQSVNSGHRSAVGITTAAVGRDGNVGQAHLYSNVPAQDSASLGHGSNPFDEDEQDDEDRRDSSLDVTNPAGNRVHLGVDHSTSGDSYNVHSVGHETAQVASVEEASRGGDMSGGVPVYESIGGGLSTTVSQSSRGSGVQVKALYDYEGLEDDELSFKSGDVFMKIVDEDEQGWCTGELNGHVGLYPANYCNPVK